MSHTIDSAIGMIGLNSAYTNSDLPDERVIELLKEDLNTYLKNKYHDPKTSLNFKGLNAKKTQEMIQSCLNGDFESNEFSISELFKNIRSGDEVLKSLAASKMYNRHLEELCKTHRMEELFQYEGKKIAPANRFYTTERFYQENSEFIDKLMLVEALAHDKLKLPKLDIEFNEGITIHPAFSTMELSTDCVKAIGSQALGQCGYQITGEKIVNPESSIQAINNIKTNRDFHEIKVFAEEAPQNTIYFIFDTPEKSKKLFHYNQFETILGIIKERGCSAHLYTNNEILISRSKFDKKYKN